MESILNYWYRFSSGAESPLIVLVLIFLTVALLTGVFVNIFLRKEKFGPRLTKVLNQETKKTKKDPSRSDLFQRQSTSLVSKVADPLHKFADPSKEESRTKIRHRLLQAGFRSKQAYRNYLASKVLCTFLFPGGYLLHSIFYSISSKDLNICLILAAVGFFVPNIVLLQMVQKRQQRITKAFPDALDLMVVCVEAGLGLDMIFKRVGEEMQSLCRDLSEEYQLTILEVQAGVPRDRSLTNMAVRTGVPEVASLMTILIQTNKLGTSLAKTLRVHADAMRTKRRQLAEERAAKTPVKLMVPLILFILPALFVVIIGPGAIRVINTLLPALSRH